MENLPEEVIQQIKAAVFEAFRMERENEQLRQKWREQMDFLAQCERHNLEMEQQRKISDMKRELFEEMYRKQGEEG